jgi:hypothetical protein
MKMRKAFIHAFAVLLLSGIQAAAQNSAPPKLTQAQWNDDIDLFVKKFSASGNTFDLSRGLTSRGQIDFDKLYPRETFYPAIAELKAHLGERSDSSIALDLMRIVASAHVGHTTIYTGSGLGFADWLPIGFRWFPDGLAVVSSTSEYKPLIGKRLVTLGGQTPEQIETRLGVYISAETRQWLHSKLQEDLSVRPYLEALGAVEADGQVTIV